MKQEDGITVTKRDVKGRSLPIFRGVAVIDSKITQVLAVMYDVDRHPEWMHRCVGAKLFKRWGDRGFLIYNRTKVPWPASDRDAILRVDVSVNWAKREVILRFKSVESSFMGPVDGVVRMPKLKGFYKLKEVDGKNTHVEYQVDADPGGWIPSWIATLVTRTLPFGTLRKLRFQARRTNGWYAARVKTWDEQLKKAITKTAEARP